jgi:hypothetical protein
MSQLWGYTHIMTTDTITYAVQHPAMNLALIMETSKHHTHSFLRNMAAMHILREFDEMLAPNEFVVQATDPDTTEINLF